MWVNRCSPQTNFLLSTLDCPSGQEHGLLCLLRYHVYGCCDINHLPIIGWKNCVPFWIACSAHSINAMSYLLWSSGIILIRWFSSLIQSWRRWGWKSWCLFPYTILVFACFHVFKCLFSFVFQASKFLAWWKTRVTGTWETSGRTTVLGLLLEGVTTQVGHMVPWNYEIYL